MDDYEMTVWPQLVSNKLAVEMTLKACIDPDLSARRIYCIFYN